MSKKYIVLVTQRHCVERGFGMVDVEIVSAKNKKDAIRKAIKKNKLDYEHIYSLVNDEINLVAIKCEPTEKNDGGHFFASLVSRKTPVIVVDESF